MMSIRQLGHLVGSAAILLGAGCTPNLDVTNPNSPDVARALASPEDVKNLAVSSVNSWYLGSTDLHPYLVMSVTSDAGTANFGNFGMRFNNLEPRIAYANNSAGGDRDVAAAPWDNSYSALGAANDVLRAFGTGLQLDGGAAETDQFKQLAQFVQAAEFTNLALIFDQAFVVDETLPVGEKPELKPYKDVAAAAIAKWDALIAASTGKSYVYDQTVLPLSGTTLSSSKLNRIANTMAALTLAYTPRNAASAATVDWAKVAQYAAKGIGTGTAGAPFDLTVVGDNNTWYSYIAYYGAEPSWMKVDMRLINRMDPNSPPKFTGTIPPQGTSADARFTSDYNYDGKVIGDPSRGIYMQSPYSHKRYSFYRRTSSTRAVGPVPYILAAESDLVRAEALIRSGGDLTTAASLINTTRVGRGQLTPASAADGAAKLLSYIDYERDVELLNTSGFTLFQRRHVDGLQPGTWHHLPIPAKELETLALPIYTFGGIGKEESLSGLGGTTLRFLTPLENASAARLELPNGSAMTLHFPPRRSGGPSARIFN
jgi:starch-binding outer membrane protein, SusD/RagB family